MADNVTTQSGTASSVPAGTVIATDEIAGVEYQRVKAVWGADGVATDISAANPLPVTAISSGLPTGAATEATLATRLSESDFDTKIGSLTETAPATDTASSGLNGRFQRACQRLTSIIALLPTSLGSGGGLKVDGSGTALPVSGTVALGAGSAVVGHVIADAGSTTAVTGNVATTVADGANAVEGVTTGAAVITDANGTIQQYLRGLIKQWAAGALGVVLTAETSKVIGTVRVASGGIASGSLASGSVASGAVASGAVASGAFASGSISDGADVTQGAKADAKNSATDTTSITIMQVLKQISFSIQAAAASLAGSLTVATHAVTGSGNFASTVADGADVTFGAKTDAKSTATDATSITAMQVLKQISASVQATPAIAAGTNSIGKVYASYQTTKALTNASVSASASGENTLVSGTGGQTIRVFKLCLTVASAVSVTLKDAAGGTSLTGAIPLVANGSLTIDVGDGEPAFVTASSGAFILSLSAAVSTTGFVQYTKS